jgi:hypothetical protein
MKLYNSNVIPIPEALVSNYGILTTVILFAFLKASRIHCLEIQMPVWCNRISSKSSLTNPVLALQFTINEIKTNTLIQNRVQLCQ